MKILTAIISIIFLLWLAEVKITFNPFSVTFGNAGYVVGMILICIGVSVISISSERKAYKRGLDNYREMVFEVLDEMKKEKNKTE
ncbi:MAG: hypothetical protein RR346_10000 [Bacteroidales bacterium]